MAFDRTKINMAVPLYDVDKTIGIHTGTITVAAPIAGAPDFGLKTGIDTFDTGFGDSCYFEGIFSVDSGVTWNDFGAMKPDLSLPTAPQFQTQDCNCSMINGILTTTAYNYYNTAHGTSAPYTYLFKIALFAKNTQGRVTPLSTNQILAYNSAYNFQKIFLQDSFPFNLAGTNTTKSTAINHGLGYFPKVRAFYKESSGSLRMLPISNYEIEPRVDASNVTFYHDAYWDTVAINGSVEWRIYLDS